MLGTFDQPPRQISSARSCVHCIRVILIGVYGLGRSALLFALRRALMHSGYSNTQGERTRNAHARPLQTF